MTTDNLGLHPNDRRVPGTQMLDHQRPTPTTNTHYWDSIRDLMTPNPELRRHQDIYSLARQLLVARMTGYLGGQSAEAQRTLWDYCMEAATIAVDSDIAARQLLKKKEEAPANVENPAG